MLECCGVLTSGLRFCGVWCTCIAPRRLYWWVCLSSGAYGTCLVASVCSLNARVQFVSYLCATLRSAQMIWIWPVQCAVCAVVRLPLALRSDVCVPCNATSMGATDVVFTALLGLAACAACLASQDHSGHPSSLVYAELSCAAAFCVGWLGL